MCGIFGYFSTKFENIPFEIVNSMGDLIRHRGPDDSGIFYGEGVAIGNQRLSIIDIEGGHQPFISADGNIALVQNGEIYNHIELAEELRSMGHYVSTESDTEVLLRLYECYGLEFIGKLNGMFSIAIYDKNVDELYIIRDRVGVKPLYVYYNGITTVFGSEIKAILAGTNKCTLDEQAINHYLAYNFVPPPYTMFKEIRHLMPGHYMKITRKGTTAHQWWDLSQQHTEEGRSENDWIETFNHLLEDAVRIRLRADVSFGAFLSGGIDSSTVVGLMSKHMTQPVKTFSIGFHDPRYDESKYAQMAADLFSTDHTCEKVDPNMLDLWSLMIYHCDQPHGDVSFMPTYKVSRLAAAHVKMVLTGDGGDELFAGYDKYKHFFQNDLDSMNEEQFRRAYFDNISLFTDSQKRELLTDDFKKKVAGMESFEVITPLFNASSHMDRLNQALYIDMMHLLPGNNLVKPDRMGMAVSLEARTPFLDYRMMEMAFRIPGKLKLKDGETKYIYKKAVTSLLGEELVFRKKQMFTVPVGEWFRKELASFVQEKLMHGHLIRRNIVNASYVEFMISHHQKGMMNFTREIRALISLEYWFDLFMNDDG